MDVVCCQLEVSASGWSLAQRNPIECGVSECHRKSPLGEAMTPNRIEDNRNILSTSFAPKILNI